MRCFISKSSNPYFNLATEEYFLKNSSDEIFMLYTNEPCIVAGKHQNLYSEINLPFARENNIKLVRRISGGGTVYQDLNNLNFSFIHNCENREQINFTKFTLPILEALRELGLQAEFSGRNDLLIDKRKISGNAMHIYKTRVLSHGTLLYDADLNQLSASLKSHNERYTDKSIKSVRSEVTNISYYLNPPKPIEIFKLEIFKKILNNTKNISVKSLDIEEVKVIRKISKEKFETWEWIYGYSPKYVFKNNITSLDSPINIEFAVERGIILDVNIRSSSEISILVNPLTQILTGMRHDYDCIELKLKEFHKTNSQLKYLDTEFCAQLF